MSVFESVPARMGGRGTAASSGLTECAHTRTCTLGLWLHQSLLPKQFKASGKSQSGERTALLTEKNWSDLIKQNISVWCQTDLMYGFKETPETVHQALFSLMVFAVVESIKAWRWRLAVNARRRLQGPKFSLCSNVFIRSLALDLFQGSYPNAKSYGICLL